MYKVIGQITSDTNCKPSKMRVQIFAAVLLIAGISAQCPKECPEMYKPVCASNGKTYGNDCELKMVICNTEDALVKVSDGECAPATRHPTQPTRPPTVPTEVTDPEGSGETEPPEPTGTKLPTNMPKSTATFRPLNYTKHPISNYTKYPIKNYTGYPVFTTRSPCSRYYCPSFYSPVCGADGVTYRNLNCYSKAVCEYRQKGLSLRYLYRGPCKNGTLFKPLPKYCAYKSCPYKPVCGSDGKTYSSSCYMDYSNCRNNRDVTVVRQGSCPPQSTLKPTTSRCVYNGTLCPAGGPRNPVCGTDGRNYFTVCYLEYMNCIYNRTVSVASKGYCPYKTTTPKPCNQNCGWTYKPVCGSDGRSYRSLCHLQNQACKLQYIGGKLTVKYYGNCKQPTTVKPYTTGNPLSACSKLGPCPTYYRPVCASNNITYRNTCYYSQAECRMLAYGQDIKLKSLGECKNVA
ncbi:agrin [Lingula anatina]|uniref:Agrin n=1 Tax=Lingula anatina TaxID=7574 RepID=A0A1S3K9T4_LINAN|nr:agrin [Lingula anatina]|eukprot:XP_013419390.1 agrin [Lingula anatina]